MGLFKKTYKIVYDVIGFTSYKNITTYIRARNMGNAIKILNRKEDPWDIHIVSIEEVKD